MSKQTLDAIRVCAYALSIRLKMKKDWVLTQDGFDALLDWLDADRERAGSKYESIRLRLIKIFICNGCGDAEELADETINRAITRVDEIASNYDGDPLLYFIRISHFVYQEHSRKSKARQTDIPVEEAADQAEAPSGSLDGESEYECLERCLEHLPELNRKLVLEYYQHEKQAKIDHRKRLAMELGIAVNALRIRAYRIRVALEECVHDCVRQLPVN